MKKIILLLALLSCIELLATAPYSVYLIRHTEKDLTHQDTKNPPLTACGVKRAQSLVTLFKDIDLTAVYSTNYIRTIASATPTAESKGLTISVYDPYNLNAMLSTAQQLKSDILIVGHNSTTNVLAGKLAGIELPIIPETEYDRLYQVTVFNGEAKLQLMHQVFRCADD